MSTLFIILAVTLVALVTLIVIWLIQRKKNARLASQNGTPVSASGDEVAALIREAEARLAGAKLEQGARVSNLPVYIVVGDTGATKTSVMLHSGLEPELLAGQVYQNDTVVPTRTANLWFSRRAILVEAGGSLLSDSGKWNRLLQRLQPRSSVVGKGEQAPRAVLVCFDCETFTQRAAGDLAVAAARNLRARLTEISQSMGINLPVYVLFTKIDRLPYFTEYVRNLSNEEATQVLGVTLPMNTGRGEGVYAEEETGRLSANFERLFRSLADARPELLSRETDAGKLPAAYEFPREFRKIRATAVQFLVDLCRPSQLTVGPFLRGFYFTGVRPVIVNETAPVAAAPQPQAGYGPASGATGIFKVGALSPAHAPAAPPVIGTRKVPQWLFLSHLFNDILLTDRAAMGTSGASTKTSSARRLLFLAAAALCLILSICFTVSFFRNHALEARVQEAARGISSGESTGTDLASLDGLGKLETLRQSLETLAQYHRVGAPWSYRWGLYAGDDLYPAAQRVYFDRFKQLLFGQTQSAILQLLRGLPTAPGPEYGSTYDALKAYLITTSHHDKSTKLFLPPVLMKWWANGRTVDSPRAQLAQKQFDFYAEQLKEENPYSKESDGFAIDKSRRYLAQFAGAERVYAFMLAEAGKNNPPIDFNRQFPGSAQTVIESHQVPGAFSKGGWAFMKDAIAHADRYFSGEQWVLGDQASGNIDRAKLEQDARARYFSDFVKEWRTFLKSAGVVRYAGLKDASQKLTQLSGNQSPLLELFSLASQNTAVDDAAVAAVFQPVQTVVPPGSTDRFIAPANQNYMNALVTLQTSIEAIAGQAPPNDAAAAQTLGNATQAKVTTRQMAQAFRIDAEGHIEGQVQKLLEDPIVYAESLLRTLGPAELNGKGKSLCGQFRTTMAKYPFNPGATTEATLAEVNGLFRKPDGALWTFYDQNLQKLLPRQGNAYVPSSTGGVTLNPAFVNFFNVAAGFSDAVYAGGTQDPHLTYTLKPEPADGIQTVTLRIDGQALSYSGGAVAAKQFTWEGGGAHEAKATVKFGNGPDLAWSNNEGLWAVFQFFAKAERWQAFGSSQSLEWVIRIGKDAVTLPSGKALTVKFDLDMAGAPPVFQRAYLSRLTCVADVGH